MAVSTLPPFTVERFTLGDAPVKVDREKCLVLGVRVLGPRSKNGHKYPAAYLQSALPLIDGADCHWGHYLDPATRQPIDPPPDAKVGRHTHPRIENAGIHTDLRYNPKHPHIEQFLWACEHDPAQFSFSQVARVRWQPEPDGDGDKVAEACLVMNSLDIVCRGGTTNTVYESFTAEADMATDWKAAAEELETPGQIIDALTALLSGLKGIEQTVKDQILQTVVGALAAGSPAPAEGAPPEAAEPVLESLRHCYGKDPRIGWVIGLARGHFTAEADRKRRAWAAELIQKEQLAAHLRSEDFTETVAECFGNEAKARARIVERKQLGSGHAPPPRTSDGGSVAKSVKELWDEMAIG